MKCSVSSAVLIPEVYDLSNGRPKERRRFVPSLPAIEILAPVSNKHLIVTSNILMVAKGLSSVPLRKLISLRDSTSEIGVRPGVRPE